MDFARIATNKDETPGSCMLCCESTCDLTPDWLEARGISCVFFNYELDGVALKDDFGQTVAPAELYQRMLDGAEAKTSQVNVGEYVEFFRPMLKAGHDVVHVSLSSGISGTYGAACAARNLLSKEFPKRTIRIVDSLCASSGYGLLLDKLASLRDGGYTADQLADWAEKHRLEVEHWFFSTDLTFFVRGGRISKAAGAVGGMLKMCPLMHVDTDGTLQPVKNIRTRHRATLGAYARMHALARGGTGYTEKVFISQSECPDDAQRLAGMIEDVFHEMDGKVHIFDIGATIGVHTGPGTVALFFWGSGERPA